MSQDIDVALIKQGFIPSIITNNNLQIKREYETVHKNLSKNIPYVVILCLLNERYL